jgi:hypothetical protein
VDADLDTLLTALYVTIDDLLRQTPQLAPPRPPVGIPPKLSDAELVTLAVMQALLGFTSEARCCVTPGGTCATVPVPARSVRLQQAPTPGGCARSSGWWRPRPRCGAVTCVGGGLHPGGSWGVAMTGTSGTRCRGLLPIGQDGFMSPSPWPHRGRVRQLTLGAPEAGPSRGRLSSRGALRCRRGHSPFRRRPGSDASRPRNSPRPGSTGR